MFLGSYIISFIKIIIHLENQFKTHFGNIFSDTSFFNPTELSGPPSPPSIWKSRVSIYMQINKPFVALYMTSNKITLNCFHCFSHLDDVIFRKPFHWNREIRESQCIVRGKYQAGKYQINLYLV